MTPDDFDAFAEAWTQAYELVSRGKVPSPGALSLAFDTLEPYPLEQVTAALTRHVRDPDAGRYGLTPAHITRQIDGAPPTPDQVIGAALQPRTALAVLCRAHIGTHNLASYDSRQLRPYAEQCIAMLPEWRQRIASGQLTEHERGLMDKYAVPAGSHQLARSAPGARQLAHGGAS